MLLDRDVQWGIKIVHGFKLTLGNAPLNVCPLREEEIGHADSVSMADFLLSQGANVEGRIAESQLKTMHNFDTPLHIAVQKHLPNTYAMVYLLLDHGAT